MSTSVSQDFVPRKTVLGARLIASHDTSLPANLRRLLLLADGQRTVFTLSQMMPDRNVMEDVVDLMQRSMLEDGRKSMEAPAGDRLEAAAATATADLPGGWESATDFMVTRARETLGVAAIDVIEALEQANDPETARQAMSQWYRALRASRDGREVADTARIKAAAMLRGQDSA